MTKRVLEIDGFDKWGPDKQVPESVEISDGEGFFDESDYDESDVSSRYEVTITLESEPFKLIRPEIPEKARPTLFMNKRKRMTPLAKIVAAPAYLGFLWIASLFFGHSDPNIRFHVKQGFRLSLVELAAVFMVNVLYELTHFTLSMLNLGTMIDWLQPVLYLITGTYFIYLSVVGVVNVMINRQRPIPNINKLFLHLEHVKISKSENRR